MSFKPLSSIERSILINIEATYQSHSKVKTSKAGRPFITLRFKLVDKLCPESNRIVSIHYLLSGDTAPLSMFNRAMKAIGANIKDPPQTITSLFYGIGKGQRVLLRQHTTLFNGKKFPAYEVLRKADDSKA